MHCIWNTHKETQIKWIWNMHNTGKSFIPLILLAHYRFFFIYFVCFSFSSVLLLSFDHSLVFTICLFKIIFIFIRISKNKTECKYNAKHWQYSLCFIFHCRSPNYFLDRKINRNNQLDCTAIQKAKQCKNVRMKF